jgi:MinD-like ATPase involved in chromosome partitioning or flagellar assembly
MEQLTRVVLAVDAPEVLDEILHFLDRSGAVRVVATADDERQVAEATKQLEPDVVIAEPRLASHVPASTPCIAIASRESVAALRAALGAGVRAFTVWPVERDDLLRHLRSFAAAGRVFERRAHVVAVHGSRGGAGCTFVATHLAKALADRGRSTVLLDVDPYGGDVETVLGIPDGADGVHPVSALVDVVDEITPSGFADALFSHPGGFGVVTASAPDAVAPTDAAVSRLVDLAAAASDAVLLHTGRGLDAVTRSCLTSADVILEVLSLDVPAFRAAVRTGARLASDALDDRTWFVVDRAARGEVVPADVERVFGRPARVVIPVDGSVPRLQDHGRLLNPRSRAARAIARLAGQLVAAADELRGAA